MDLKEVFGSARAKHEPDHPTPAARPILIVDDDDPAIGQLLFLMLGVRDYASIAVTGAVEAVAHLKEQSFRLALLDLLMPKPGGLDFLRAVRGSLADTPVLIVTGAGDPMLHEATLALGAREILRKPFTVDDLYGAVERCLGPCEAARARGQALRPAAGGA
jgi:DNA-binding NtrC family response regulator